MGVTCGQAGTGERRDKVGVTQSVGVQQMWKVEGTEEVDSRAECDGRPKKGTKRVGYMRKVRIVQTMSGNGAEKEHGWRQEIHGQSVGVPICFRLRVKCVSLDTGSIPPEINPWAPHPLNPHPTQYLHPPCLLKCVCLGVCICVCEWFSCLRWMGVYVPCTAALAGGNRKDSCVFERNRKRKKERVEGQQACQSRASLLEWVHRLCCSLSHLLLAALVLYLLSCNYSCLFIWLYVSLILVLLSFLIAFCSTVKSLHFLSCNAPASVPSLNLSTSHCDGPVPFSRWLCSLI